MAKPDCDDGWMMLAHELFAALAYAGFTKWEWAVIREVLSQVYGPCRTRTAKVSPSDLGGRLGTHKESIVRACRSLVTCGVLRKVDVAEYRFVKDYEAWRNGQGPMLTEYEIEECRRSIPAIASKLTGNNGAPATGTVALPHKQPPGTTALPTGTVALPKGSAGAPEIVPPLRTPLLGEEKKERESVTPAPALTHAGGLDEMTTGRIGDEHRMFVQAVAELEAHKPTEYLAGALVMAADSPGIRSLPSWRLLVAVRTVQRPDKSKTWGMFQRVAETCSESDYLKLCRPLSNGTPTPASAATPMINQPASAMNPPSGIEAYKNTSDELMAKYRQNKLESLRRKHS